MGILSGEEEHSKEMIFIFILKDFIFPVGHLKKKKTFFFWLRLMVCKILAPVQEWNGAPYSGSSES